MNANLPYAIFETGQGGSFLAFDLGAERIALPCLSLNKVIFCRVDHITPELANAHMDILGEKLTALFTLLTRAKIKLVRHGTHAHSSVREFGSAQLSRFVARYFFGFITSRKVQLLYSLPECHRPNTCSVLTGNNA